MQKCAHGPAQRHTTNNSTSSCPGVLPPTFLPPHPPGPNPCLSPPCALFSFTHLHHSHLVPFPFSPSPLLLSSLCCPSHCSKVSYKYQDCKASCNSCETLRQSIQSDTGLQVRVVLELTACQDLHPSCAGWSKGGRCSKEPKAMLELCQVW